MGEVTVESVPGQRTVFSVCLRKDKTQLNGEYITELPVSHLAYDASNLDDSEEKTLLAQKYPYSVLVVEDDDEVRAFWKGIIGELSRTYSCQWKGCFESSSGGK